MKINKRFSLIITLILATSLLQTAIMPISAAKPPNTGKPEDPGQTQPSISISVTTDSSSANIGDTVIYTYFLTNTGTLPLSDVTVDDSIDGTPTYISGDVTRTNILDRGETWIYTATYTIIETDPTVFTNTATATGYHRGEAYTDSDSCSITIEHESPLGITLISQNPIGADPDWGEWGGGLYGYTVATGGGYVFVLGEGHNIYVYNAETMEYVKTMDSYGSTMATGNGYLAIGDPGFNNVYLYSLSDLDTIVTTFTDPNIYYQGFGTGIAISGDKIIISTLGNAVNDPPIVAWSGHVYVFSLTGYSLLATLESPNPTYAPWAPFGWSITLSGDSIVIGEPYGINGGNIHLYDSTTYEHVRTITNPFIGGEFGWSVASLNGDILIAAPGNAFTDGVPEPIERAGQVYCYTIDGNPVYTLSSSNPCVSGAFGYSLATDGTNTIVSAPGEDSDSTPAAGNAYIFSSEGTYLKTLTSLNPESNGGFGCSVAIGTGYYVVGAPMEDAIIDSTTYIDAGHAYILY